MAQMRRQGRVPSILKHTLHSGPTEAQCGHALARSSARPINCLGGSHHVATAPASVEPRYALSASTTRSCLESQRVASMVVMLARQAACGPYLGHNVGCEGVRRVVADGANPNLPDGWAVTALPVARTHIHSTILGDISWVQRVAGVRGTAPTPESAAATTAVIAANNMPTNLHPLAFLFNFYSRSPKNPALQLLQNSSKSASAGS